jgi:inner membrane protein YidH
VEVEDATRRTQLANERTQLAWWRTGLTALAVGLAAGRIVPELAGGAAWPFQLLGVFILYGQVRGEHVRTALERGDWAPFPASAAVATTVAGLVLGTATIVVIVFAGS